MSRCVYAPRMPSDVLPCCAALSAYSICRSLPVREKVVSEKLYAASPPDMMLLAGWLACLAGSSLCMHVNQPSQCLHAWCGARGRV